MSLREFINRTPLLQSTKRLIAPIWVSINGRTGQDAWLHAMHEHASTPIQTIVDVGSSGGFFLRKAAAHFPNAIYHHFEPRLDAAADVKKLSRRLKTQSTVHIMALADFTGTAPFAVMDYGDASSLLVTTKGVANGINISKEVQVQVDLLDTVLERIKPGQIGLLKIDVEGFERSVLRGACKTLTKQVSNIIIEITPPRHAEGPRETMNIFEMLFEASFTLLDTYNSDYLFSKDPGVLTCYSAN